MDELRKAFNLSEKELMIVYALVEYGLQPASRLSKLVSLPRSTVRGILERLVQVGLVHSVKRQGRTVFRLQSYEEILTLLELKKSKLETEVNLQIRAVKEAKKTLLKPHIPPQKPRITVFEGVEGVEQAYEHSLTSQETIRSFASLDANEEALPHYFSSYYARRAKRKIGIRSIHPDSQYTREQVKKNTKLLRSSKLCSKKYTWRPEIQIYGSTVNIVSWNDKVALLIESGEISLALKQIFDMCFEALP